MIVLQPILINIDTFSYFDDGRKEMMELFFIIIAIHIILFEGFVIIKLKNKYKIAKETVISKLIAYRRDLIVKGDLHQDRINYSDKETTNHYERGLSDAFIQARTKLEEYFNYWK